VTLVQIGGWDGGKAVTLFLKQGLAPCMIWPSLNDTIIIACAAQNSHAARIVVI